MCLGPTRGNFRDVRGVSQTDRTQIGWACPKKFPLPEIACLISLGLRHLLSRTSEIAKMLAAGIDGELKNYHGLGLQGSQDLGRYFLLDWTAEEHVCNASEGLVVLLPVLHARHGAARSTSAQRSACRYRRLCQALCRPLPRALRRLPGGACRRRVRFCR